MKVRQLKGTNAMGQPRAEFTDDGGAVCEIRFLADWNAERCQARIEQIAAATKGDTGRYPVIRDGRVYMVSVPE